MTRVWYAFLKSRYVCQLVAFSGCQFLGLSVCEIKGFGKILAQPNNDETGHNNPKAVGKTDQGRVNIEYMESS